MIGPLCDSRGQSLIQVMITVGIMSIMMLSFATMISTQQREMTFLSQKLAAMDLEKLLIASLADGSVCEYVMNEPSSLTFDSTQVSSAPQVISLPAARPLYASVKPGPPLVLGPVVAEVGQIASVYSSAVEIQSIKLSISGAPSPMPPPGSGIVFTGSWQVDFNPAKLARSMKPISIAMNLIADTNNPTAAKITGCQVSAISGGGGGSGGAPNCRTINDQGPSPVYKSHASCAADEYLLSGGGLCAAGGTGFSVTGSERGTLIENRPDGNGWTVDCYDWSFSTDVPSMAWAVCCEK